MTIRRQSGPQPVHFPLGGGMDLITPSVAKAPGRVIASLNYEPVATGYRRLRGFERFNGLTAPSRASANLRYLPFAGGTTLTAALTPGRRIGGGTGSTAYAVVLEAPRLMGGSYAANTATGWIPILLHSGTYANGTGISSSGGGGSEYGVATAAQTSLWATTPYGAGDHDTHLAAAPGIARGDIYPPGEAPNVSPSGKPIDGIWFYDGAVYAFRGQGGAETMFKAGVSYAGWAGITFGRTLAFTLGVSQPTIGQTLTGATSSAASTIQAIVVQSGTFAGGDAAGYFTVYNQTGSYVAETVKVGPTNIAHVAANSSGGTLPQGGTYEFMNHNFYGASNLERMYGVSGTAQAFEYKTGDSALTFISTGMPVDTPNHLAAHRGSLFLSFPGGSVQFSTVGEPKIFNPVLGAGEIGVGSDVTALIPANSGTLTILAERSVNVLYGNDHTDYQMDVLSNEAGGLAHTDQRLGTVVYMDNRGLRTITSTASYGNFTLGTISMLIAPLLKDLRDAGVTPTTSFVCRTEGQYWLFFDNGTGIVVFMGAKQPSILPINLGGAVVTCSCSVEINGEERIFVGTKTGWVYEMNAGNDFDGAPLEHYLRLAFNHFGSPHVRKRVHKVTVGLAASGPTTLLVSADYDYGADQGTGSQTLAVTTGGAEIDSLGSNELYYTAQIETEAEAYLDGVAKNVSLKIGGLTTGEVAHTLTDVTYHISPRGLER